MSETIIPPVTEPSQFLKTIHRMTVIGTGGMTASLLPTWLLALRSWYPQLTIDCVLTHSAMRLVSPACVQASTGRPVVIPDHGPELPGNIHRTLAADSDLILVYPMTLNFTSKLALMITESTALYIAAIAECPVITVPSIPEQAWHTDIVGDHLGALKQRGIHVVPPAPGIAAFSGQMTETTPASIHDVCAFLDSALLPARKNNHV